MTITMKCPACGCVMAIDAASAGNTLACPGCRQPITLPPVGKLDRADKRSASGYQGRSAPVASGVTPTQPAVERVVPVSVARPAGGVPRHPWEMLSVCALLALSISALAALLTALWPGQLAGFLIAMVAVLPGVGAYLITDNGRHSNPIATTAGLVMPLSILIIALSLFFRSGPTPSASAAEQTGESATTAPGKPEAKVDLLADASRYPLTSAVVSVYPNHIIVFPTQGTIRENVEQILKSIFPADKVTTIRGDTAQRDAQRTTLLKEQLKQSLDSIKDLGKLSELLSALAAKQIRFKGYIPSDPKEAIVRIIQRGGVFTFSVSADPVLPKERHGSLLHTNGIDQLVGRGKITGAEQRNLLHLFRRAVQDYAFMTDALSVVGERPAFLIYIGRSPEAHEDAMAKLLHRMDNPVFVPRTPPRLFDAVDPTEDVGGGSATYTLRLPRQCWWRWVGARDRKGLKRASSWAT